MVGHLTDRLNRRSEAALPPDVRKGSAFPAVALILILQAARLSLAACDKRFGAGDGKPKAFRTSGGKAALSLD